MLISTHRPAPHVSTGPQRRLRPRPGMAIPQQPRTQAMNEDKQQIGADMIGKYVIVRTYSAGCHAGTLADRDGREGVLTGARRLWRWAGAASLSEMANRGTSRPNDCSP